ncbi:serine protease inhibitor, putative [Pediculus humanus corporis]|uniref:Serine protease inhibitor, putative n=1 Tax=Pediculus humanus subsp. corporis TaxID=121224 RepID=E0VTF8_PEDHC|nr:serine protease inhibitor, putative [Pediculus humanus corporis]EEB16664.1 serine protease inhibitor, putative [Pediculus humanus corporis]
MFDYNPGMINEFGTTQNLAYFVANLGLKTLRDLLTKQNNVIISPLNIYSCLDLLSFGAVGKTKEELENVLGPKNSNETLSNILIPTTNGTTYYSSSVFLDDNFTPRQEFLNLISANYDASVINVNMTNGEQTKNLINKWVSDKTNGTIKNLIQQSIDPTSRMIVVSALLFKGKWLQSFSPSATTKGKFIVDENTSVNVDLMNLIATVPVVKNPLLDAIGLPYKNPGMYMYLILPKAHGINNLKKLLSHLNVNSLKKLKSESVNEEIIIIIPKIKIDVQYSLTKPLNQAGLSAIFNPSQANFANLAVNDTNLFLSEIYHSVHFEMNEEGTIASAATASVLTKSSKFIFKASRPFILVITDDKNLILFMGAIINPH